MKQIEDNAPVLNMDRHGTIKEPCRGLPYKIRKQRLAEVYSQGWDPDELAHGPDYSHLERRMQEVLSTPPRDWPGGWWPEKAAFKVRLHPWLNRICLFVQQLPNKNTRAPLWFVVSIFWTENEDEDYLPVDYRSDIRKRHLAGCAGDFREPTDRDWELIREAVITDFRSQEAKEDKAYDDSQKTRMDQVRDIADYTFGYERDSANMRAGSGEFMSSAHCDRRDNWLPFEDKRFVKIDRGVYKERVRVGSARFIELVTMIGAKEPTLIPSLASVLQARDLEASILSSDGRLELERLLGRLTSIGAEVSEPTPDVIVTEKIRQPDGSVIAIRKRVKV